jgi:hypothetical protein
MTDLLDIGGGMTALPDRPVRTFIQGAPPAAGDFDAFADRIKQGGTLDDDIAAGRVMWDESPPRRAPWYRRLGNWLLEVFGYE